MKHEEELIEISKKIVEMFGLNFQPNQLQDLERRIIAAARELKIDHSIQGIKNWLLNTPSTNSELNALSAHLTINETYFFREKPAIDLFIEKIIPGLIKHNQDKKEIRIWCAGCSSGEEPYTLAIILKEYFPILSDWNIMILATDISPVAIQKALHGEYTEWSFRETNDLIKNKYFITQDKHRRILPDIKKMVTFTYLNLSKNSYPSSLTNTDNMDVIYCRNVMMYFAPEVIHEVSARFYNALVENGWLITSQVELNDEYFSNFRRVYSNNGVFYNKSKIHNEPKVNTFCEPSEIKRVNTIKPKGKKLEVKILNKRSENEVTKKSKHNEKKSLSILKPEEFYLKGQYDKCIESCIQTIESGNFDNKTFTLLIKSYSNSGILIKGEKTIKKLLLNNAATSEIYYLYASFLKEQNEINESEIVLKKAIYLNHRHILSHLMLGDISSINDKKNIAVKYYKTVIELLEKYNDNDILPDSDGLTAGRIKALAISMINNL